MEQVKSTKRRYVALGDLVADCYYKDGKLLKIDGGSSRFNVICNLAARGNQTCVISACGNDILGTVALESLRIQGVDTNLVKQMDCQTKAYHLILKHGKHESIKACPICGKRTWYDESLSNTAFSLSQLKDDDIIILDGLKDENLPILRQAHQDKVIDIGRIKRLCFLTNAEILSLLESKLEIIQLNEIVEKYLFLRFQLENDSQLFSLLKPKLLVVTRGKEGADFITEDLMSTKRLIYCQDEVDDTGAGDTFFSFVVQSYFDNDKIVDMPWMDATFYFANQLTCKVVSNLGARGHLWSGYKPNSNNCICEM